MIPNQWYVVLESREVKPGRLLGVTRMGEQLVFARDGSGKAFCLRDRCAHRGAALSAGKHAGDAVACPFHGFRYDASGRGVLIPANGRNAEVPERFRVHAYPVYEAHGWLWIWWGERPPARIPAPRYFEDLDGFAWASAVDPWDAHYSRVIENQLDVVHLPFVHYNTIGRGNRTLVNGPGGGVARAGPVLRAGLQRGRHRAAGPDARRDRSRRTRRSTSTSSSPTSGRTGSPRRSGSGRRSCPWTRSTRCCTCASTRSSCRARSGSSSRASRCPMNLRIAHQDRRVVQTQQPKASGLKIGENLVQGDGPVAEYRRGRQELMDAARA